jgi:hypothetical protein
MKHNKYPQNPKPASVWPSTAVTVLNKNEIDFVPSPDEVARRAYFSYVNQGSRSGHEVQHWLEAEAQLLVERGRTRTHDFHNKS